jgi:hypothetical protein
MSLFTYIKRRIRRARGRAEQKALKKMGAPAEITRDDWPRSLKDPKGFYLDCYRYFHFKLPEEFVKHREYFSKEQRGFGEDAFHTMWFLLFQEFKPAEFLEIGVWRGQTTSLAALNQRRLGITGFVAGIAPFQPSGDSAWHHDPNLDHQKDTIKNFDAFQLPHPTLLKAFSTDKEAIEFIRSRVWDCIYIDGDHEYPTVKSDWEVCSIAVKVGGIIVMDDSGLGTAFEKDVPRFATAGIQGSSKLVGEIDRSKFAEILQVGHNRVFQRIA